MAADRAVQHRLEGRFPTSEGRPGTRRDFPSSRRSTSLVDLVVGVDPACGRHTSQGTRYAAAVRAEAPSVCRIVEVPVRAFSPSAWHRSSFAKWTARCLERGEHYKLAETFREIKPMGSSLVKPTRSVSLTLEAQNDCCASGVQDAVKAGR